MVVCVSDISIRSATKRRELAHTLPRFDRREEFELLASDRPMAQRKRIARSTCAANLRCHGRRSVTLRRRAAPSRRGASRGMQLDRLDGAGIRQARTRSRKNRRVWQEIHRERCANTRPTRTESSTRAPKGHCEFLQDQGKLRGLLLRHRPPAGARELNPSPGQLWFAAPTRAQVAKLADAPA